MSMFDFIIVLGVAAAVILAMLVVFGSTASRKAHRRAAVGDRPSKAKAAKAQPAAPDASASARKKKSSSADKADPGTKAAPAAESESSESDAEEFAPPRKLTMREKKKQRAAAVAELAAREERETLALQQLLAKESKAHRGVTAQKDKVVSLDEHRALAAAAKKKTGGSEGKNLHQRTAFTEHQKLVEKSTGFKIKENKPTDRPRQKSESGGTTKTQDIDQKLTSFFRNGGRGGGGGGRQQSGRGGPMAGAVDKDAAKAAGMAGEPKKSRAKIVAGGVDIQKAAGGAWQ